MSNSTFSTLLTSPHNPFSQNAVKFGEEGNNSPYGIRQIGTQQYLPIQAKRQLTPLDQAEVQRGLSQWFPNIFQSYATPLYKMLASPFKSSLLSGLVAGGAAALYAGLSRLGGGTIALVGGGAALLVGIISYFSRQQANDNVLDLMQRLPEGATKRDMLSDPVYQKDLDRRAMAAGGYGGGGDLSTLLIAQSLMGGHYGGIGHANSFRNVSYGGGSRSLSRPSYSRPISVRPTVIRSSRR
ncbi:MAG: hypothetical protein QE263_02180 [Vampirovibrionales bacterium]|nr:hypothetical protein [Vampirovibrionales bacterium]